MKKKTEMLNGRIIESENKISERPVSESKASSIKQTITNSIKRDPRTNKRNIAL